MPLIHDDSALVGVQHGFERTKALFANFYRGAVWGGNDLNTDSPGFLRDCRYLHELLTGRMSYNEFYMRHEALAEMPRMLEYLVGNGALPGAVLPEEVKVIVVVNASGPRFLALQAQGEYDEDDTPVDLDYAAWATEDDSFEGDAGDPD